jgi:hypothetical protein
MQYMFLIYGDERGEANGSSDRLAEYGAFSQLVNEKGIIRGASRLRPTDAATTVRVRNGAAQTTDGPFAETKEQLGGYYILDCKDLDEALSYAAKIPSAKDGSVEVRPVWEM